MGLFVDTVSGNVTIADLGITLTHPTVNFNIGAQFSSEEVKNSSQLTSAITSGTLNWKKTSGGPIQLSADYDSDYLEIERENLGPGYQPDRVVTFKDMTSFAGAAPVICGYSANAGAGRFMEFISGNSSDVSPFLVVNQVILIAISMGGTTSTTAVVGVYKNGDFVNSIATLTLTSQQYNYNTSLNVSLVVGDILSLKIISGSINKPFVALYISRQ